MNLDFLVPGFSKCGTTSLCALLNEHPDIFIPDEKEPLFFIHADHLDKLGWYQGLFAAAPEHARCGEGSTFYSSVAHEVGSRDRIVAFNPDIKLIFIARDPIARIESSFREYHHSGPHFGLNTPYDIETALDALPDLLSDSCFWSRLNNYRQRIADDNILLVFLEDLQAQPDAVLMRCFEFLGVDAAYRSSNPARRLNEGEAKLFDSDLWRYLRNAPVTRQLIARIPVPVQDKFTQPLGLRKPFKQPIEWSAAACERVVAQLRDEVRQILEYGGKPPDFWKRFAGLKQQVG